MLTEADSHLGLTNRLLAGRARRVCLAFPLDGPRRRPLPRHRPPRAAADRDPRGGARRVRARRPAERCVLVFGGSLGARSINEAAVAAFADAPYRVLHIAGRRDFPDLTAPGPHYDLRDYVIAVRHRARRGRPRRGALGRLGLRARPVRPPGRADPLSARDRRPSDHERALDGARAARPTVLADAELTPRSAPHRRSTRSCSTRRGSRPWPRPRRAWRGPTRPPRSRARCCGPPIVHSLRNAELQGKSGVSALKG